MKIPNGASAEFERISDYGAHRKSFLEQAFAISNQPIDLFQAQYFQGFIQQVIDRLKLSRQPLVAQQAPPGSTFNTSQVTWVTARSADNSKDNRLIFLN